MPTMRAMVVHEAKGRLAAVERDLPEPGAGEIRLRVEACGVCHSDAMTVEGLWPGIRYPRVPGHEAIGVVDALGAGVQGFAVGDRAGVGWFGGACGYCRRCRRDSAFACETVHEVTGITRDGGYATHMVALASAVAHVPDDLDSVESAPLLCAGVTTFNALRHSGAGPGDLVAVLGVGGLGHLGIQFAARQGFRAVAVNRGRDKEALARELGASDYIDSAAQDPAEALTGMGGAKAILATVTSGPAMQAIAGGLGPNGVMMVIGVVGPLTVDAVGLIGKSAAIRGWYSGVARDSEDTLLFSRMNKVASMNEVYPLARAQEAYERMMSGEARFRVVLRMD
ncbi:alcohol dehydrogenase [Roseiarcus fermentans]|uniref:Alcohol dehydrogenase n=1 Tax=Roseiarcus fermentans TaxID=1473586 RepID=A0A366EYF8_9HYPH|nr:alcohol dehydrogenase catalytic domain-containing protein [Roseiarcus fermentans]RBP06495.1 alcohol dehydrogenase [Roseiarcus fermentans]